MKIRLLSDKSEDLIKKRLNISPSENLLDRDFQATSTRCDFEHKEAEKYANRNRGSVRISCNNYYTHKEYQDFSDSAIATPLP